MTKARTPGCLPGILLAGRVPVREPTARADGRGPAADRGHEAEAATANDYAGLTSHQREARGVAGMILAAVGHADHVDDVALSDIEAAVDVGRTVTSDIRKEAQELLAGGYDPITAYPPARPLTRRRRGTTRAVPHSRGAARGRAPEAGGHHEFSARHCAPHPG